MFLCFDFTNSFSWILIKISHIGPIGNRSIEKIMCMTNLNNVHKTATSVM